MENLNPLAGVMVPMSRLSWASAWRSGRSTGITRNDSRIQERQLMIEKGLTPPPICWTAHDHAGRPACAAARPAVPRHRLASGTRSSFHLRWRVRAGLGVTAAIVGSLGLGTLCTTSSRGGSRTTPPEHFKTSRLTFHFSLLTFHLFPCEPMSLAWLSLGALPPPAPPLRARERGAVGLVGSSASISAGCGSMTSSPAFPSSCS